MSTDAHQRRRTRATVLLTAAFAALFLFATSAHAASVYVSGGTLTFTASSGEANDLTITPSGAGFRVVDAGLAPLGLAATGGCSSSAGATTGDAVCTGVSAINVQLNDGADTARVNVAATTAPNATVAGGSGADRLYTGPGNDSVNGGTEGDWVDGGLGNDSLVGGGGGDLVMYSSHSQPVTARLDGVGPDGQAGESDTIASDFEYLLGGSGNDTLTGNSGQNYLSGGHGNDTIVGGGGGDYLGYWERTDPVRVDLTARTAGGAGESDVYSSDIHNVVGGAAGDTLIGDASANVLWGGFSGGGLTDGDDVLDGRGGPDLFMGDAGRDTVDYSSRTQPVTVTLDGLANDGEQGEADNASADVENVTGGSGADTLTGHPFTAIANVLAGGPGADTLDGVSGNDTLDGGDGGDSLIGGTGDDVFRARDGIVDALSCGAGADSGPADREDGAAADCESLELPAVEEPAPPTGDQPPVDPPARETPDPKPPRDRNAPDPAAVVVPAQTATVTPGGNALVKVGCPKDSGGCRGSVTLQIEEDAGNVRASGRPRMVKVGSTRFSAKAGQNKTVTVRLSRRGRRRVIRKRGRSRGRLVVKTQTADGRTLTTTRDIKLARRSPARRPTKPKGRKSR